MTLDENRPDPRPVTLRDLVRASELLLGRHPLSMHDYKALGSRLGKAINRRPYTGYYIRYIFSGEQPITKPLEKAVTNLINELKFQPPKYDTYTVTVQVPYGTHVPEKALVVAPARTCVCGVTFVPRIWNQINHSRACAKLRAQIQRTK